MKNKENPILTFTRIDMIDPDSGGKHFKLNPDGTIDKKTVGYLNEGRAYVETVEGIAGFADYLAALEPGSCALTFGLPKVQVPPDGVRVLSGGREDAAGNAEAIARKRKHFEFKEVSGIAAFDYDPPDEASAMDRRALLGVLVDVVPAFAAVALVWWCSSSSYIRREDGTEVAGLRGQRLYVPILDMSDWERAASVIQKRLVLAGYGHIQISGSGGRLLRTTFDASMAQPERLDYAAGAVCGDGLRQDRGHPLSRPGEPLLDTRAAIPDLTPAEETEYEKKLAELKEAALPAAKAQRADWLAAHCAAKARSELGPDASDEAVMARAKELEVGDFGQRLKALADGSGDWQVLSADHPIALGRDQIVTVRDILKDPEAFVRKSVCDPVEHDYRDFHTAATLFPSSRTLHSHAHGAGLNYVLGTDAEFSEILAERAKPLLADIKGTVAKIEAGDMDLLSPDAVLFAWRLRDDDADAFTRLHDVACKARKVRDWKSALRAWDGTVRAEGRSERARETFDPATTGKPGFDMTNPDVVMSRLVEVEQVLAAREDVFSMGTETVHIQQSKVPGFHVARRDEHGEVVMGEDGKPVLDAAVQQIPVPLDKGALMSKLHESFTVFKKSTDGKTDPKYFPREPLGALHSTMGVHLPPLSGVASHPIWDGKRLVSGYEYDAATGLMSNCPEVDTDSQAFPDGKTAYRWLRDELLADFAFADESDAVAAVAYAMSLMASKGAALMHAAGPPLFVVNSTQHYSGKTLLLVALGLAVTGRAPPTSNMPDNREEMSKVLNTVVANSSTTLIFDNVPRGWRVGDARLDQFITTVDHEGRRLGHNSTIHGLATTVIAITGNNLQVVGDTRSRTMEIRMAPDPDQNAATREFRHPDLMRWVRQHRERILAALVAIFAADGKGVKPSGRFVEWAREVAVPLFRASGIDITERFRDVGEEDEDDGRPDLSRVFEKLHARGKTVAAGPHPYWLTAVEVGEALNTDDLVALGVDPEGGQTLRDMSRALVSAGGSRCGDYILRVSKKLSLGKRTGRHKRSAFRIDYKPLGDDVSADVSEESVVVFPQQSGPQADTAEKPIIDPVTGIPDW